ncbi:MAG: hypothetical protein NTZ50_13035 [Chloroflexi bacterium]|nr:hypothetical protein [Chloroflexota bacterium]
MQATTETPLLISVMFTLDDEGGHIYKQNITVGRSAERIGWGSAGWARAAARIRTIPPNWKLNLGSRHIRHSGLPGQIAKLLAFLRTQIVRLSQLRSTESRPVILYADWFDLVHLVIMTVSLYLTRLPKDLHFWFTYRTPTTPRRAIPYRILHFLIELRLGSHRLQLLGDSELVDDSNARSFRKDFFTMPIVTTNQLTSASQVLLDEIESALPKTKKRLWWPGRPFPRKGEAVIDAIMMVPSESAQNAAMLTSERHAVPRTSIMSHVAVPDPLTPAEFSAWMHAADVILLPYDASLHGKQGSGIFVESAAAGRMALVTDETWMAHQYRRYGYPEFIIDWTRPDLLGHILSIASDAEHQQRSREFCRRFSRFHSEDSFAAHLQELWQKVRRSEG